MALGLATPVLSRYRWVGSGPERESEPPKVTKGGSGTRSRKQPVSLQYAYIGSSSELRRTLINHLLIAKKVTYLAQFDRRKIRLGVIQGPG